ncbi:MAG: class I SAM-dependent methyltransferase [Leadbetterella sp.]|nr:class I SAM-dependent methyltransferase [Leadbetterella sp.]
MLINYEEYQAMFEVEDRMWWYRALHDRVTEEIRSASPDYRNLRVLDAGCGTGGLLTRLRAEGLSNIEGFDFNEHAVEFSKSRGLPVSQKDITDFEYPPASFDVVVSDDVLYQFDDPELLNALRCIHRVLKPGGIFITNNNAFSVFGGIHDIAVGSKRRFVKADFEHFLAGFPGFRIVKSVYWSLFLSPLILGVRLLQKLQLKWGMVKAEEVKSDVSLPSEAVNKLLYGICSLERRILKRSPFGSSLFLVIRKNQP